MLFTPADTTATFVVASSVRSALVEGLLRHGARRPATGDEDADPRQAARRIVAATVVAP
jgi:hypothetical protein